MPTYEYHCHECGHKLECFQKMTETPLKKCPQCSQEALKRGPGGGIGLMFKGPGFYITDYKKESCTEVGPGEKKESPGCCKNPGNCTK